MEKYAILNKAVVEVMPTSNQSKHGTKSSNNPINMMKEMQAKAPSKYNKVCKFEQDCCASNANFESK